MDWEVGVSGLRLLGEVRLVEAGYWLAYILSSLGATSLAIVCSAGKDVPTMRSGMLYSATWPFDRQGRRRIKHMLKI